MNRSKVILLHSSAIALLTLATTSNAERMIGQTPNQKPVVQLTHGMERETIQNQLGDPDLESVIGAIARAKANYEDQFELLFVKGKLAQIKVLTGYRKSSTEGYFVTGTRECEVVFDANLLANAVQSSDSETGTQPAKDGFYFAEARHGSDGIPVPFTPASPNCVLTDMLSFGQRLHGTSSCNGCRMQICDGTGGCDSLDSCDGIQAHSSLGMTLESLLTRRATGEFKMRLGGTLQSPQSRLNRNP